MARHIGIDIGSETIKVVELQDGPDGLRWTRRQIVEHHKEPAAVLRRTLETWAWQDVDSARVGGRLARLVDLERVPGKQAQATGLRFLRGTTPATVVSIGSHGFSVLELRDSGIEVYRENSRCSQGTGNFLRQLVERFDLSIEAASAMCEDITEPAPLSGRCPVILKTDMTHLANKGESRAHILAGLYDAVCENVQVLIKPSVSPADLVLIGGVARSRRIRGHFAAFTDRHGMRLVDLQDDDGLYVDALGCAVLAAERPIAVPQFDALFGEPEPAKLDRVPGLSDYLGRVRRLVAPPLPETAATAPIALGFDIGSTGSKLVALDRASRQTLWSGYVQTNGDPVAAAQALVRQLDAGPAGNRPITALGATGSGRDIVGSLLSTCYGAENVYVLNEIAAHAEGALAFDPRVDTIFEIGGQDAKYIRLAEGRVIDAAMNEACSAGTGSFIEEQGRKFAGVRDVVHLGEEASHAVEGVSLGQHCSVFMAEVIDEAVAAGVENRTIIAGIYDSIIQNYLNRVKGSRDVGQVIFCQGMPFAADALAAAVVRQTGSEVIIPPDPGTVGALGIALLADRALPADDVAVIDVERFLSATVVRKDNFICRSKNGCGEPGNLCRIDRLRTLVGDREQRFTWGGGCSLWDRGTGRVKLPDLAPSPFRARSGLRDALIAEAVHSRGRPTLAISGEFLLEGLLPFFAHYLDGLGFDLRVHGEAGGKHLRRGIEEGNVPFCAPMQLHHGLISEMADSDADKLFLPMLRSVERVAGEKHAVLCPIVQSSTDILRLDLGDRAKGRIVSPVIDIGTDNLGGEAFEASCYRIAEELGVDRKLAEPAWKAGLDAQRRFDDGRFALGREALSFCRAHGIVPVVVLGRTYTLYNKVLNSNVPALLREQGAMAVPIDCYPVADSVPIFHGIFWGYGQRNLRAAHQVRATEGVYSMWASNYACGPDSFSLHFYSYIMGGKPFAVIETDGHSGDAGTKTRIEAFLHCVRQDQSRHGVPTEDAPSTADRPPARQLAKHQIGSTTLKSVREAGEVLLIPPMGTGTGPMAACMRGTGVPAEVLPTPDREAVAIGRRHTSGKECVPMTITLGSLLQRIEQETDPDKRFCFFMPSANGPCRFGVYHILHKIVLERLGLDERVSVWSPVDDDYFEGVAGGFSTLIFAGLVGADMLLAALYDVRPVETTPGAAKALHERYYAELLALLEARAAGNDLGAGRALLQVANGRMFGVADLLRRAAHDFAAIKGDAQPPTVLVVGEIYVRCDPAANDFIVDRLEARGMRVRFAPFTEWLEYTDHANHLEGIARGFGDGLTSLVQRRMLARAYTLVARPLGWPARISIGETLHAAAGYLRPKLIGEAVLTVGGPVHEWREGLIDGVVSVGPLECMPTKIAEAQLFHAAEREGLASLTLQVNGDPIDPETLETFAFEVEARHRKRETAAPRQLAVAG